jgi:hypothetical protein
MSTWILLPKPNSAVGNRVGGAQLADTSIACGLSSVHVSIDGASRATYEYIRPGANLPKVLRNLRRLMVTRRLLDSHTPHVRIVLVLMRRDR